MYVYTSVIRLPKDKRLILQPFGDIQSDSLLEHLDEIVSDRAADKKRGDLVRLFGTGDYFETFSPSERVKKAGANFHETSLKDIQNNVRAKADDFVRRMSPVAEDIVTIQQGHHWDSIKMPGGIVSSDEYIAQKLGATYAGDGVAKLTFIVNGLPFTIVTMHGYGTARTDGARLSKRMRMAEITPIANWYAQAHDNSMVMNPTQTLVGDSYLKQYFTGIGCMQTSYEIGVEAGYAEKLGLRPAAIGFVRLQVWMGEKKGRPYLRYEGIA